MIKLRGVFSELMRRKVVRLLSGYVALIWLLSQGFASLFPVLGWPNWLVRAFIIAAVAAIPVLALLSWKYDLIPPQLVRDPGALELVNPGLNWAVRRHDAHGAGYVLLEWSPDGVDRRQKRFFGPVSIGREPGNHVELRDRRVSRFHAVLWAEAGAWRIRDLGSGNGTFIGADRVRGTAVLPAACELRFHQEGPVVGLRLDQPAETVVT